MNDERVEAAAKALRALEGEKQTPWEQLDYRIKVMWIGRATATLAAADAVEVNRDSVAMAWAVNCPSRHECEFLVFHDPQEAEIQAEQWNEDHDEGENPHKVMPLYPMAYAVDRERVEQVTHARLNATSLREISVCANALDSLTRMSGPDATTRITETAAYWSKKLHELVDRHMRHGAEVAKELYKDGRADERA